MKILVLRVINSSRHRKCFVRGYMHSLFVSKALTRSYLARSGFWHKQLVHIYSLRHRKYGVRGYMHELFVSKTRTSEWVSHYFLKAHAQFSNAYRNETQ